MTLHSDAATGTLLPGALYNYLKACKIDDQSNERGNQTIGLTPLALAARNGQKDTVQLLLDNSAKVDALSTQYRTPLWIVTNRGRGEDRPEIVELLLKRGADVKYSHSTLYDSTPLMNELNQGRDPDVIQLLVEMGGKTPAAEEIAKKLDDPIINDAMQSTQQRSNLRATIVDLITALILFIIAWANNPAITGIANKVFKKFQISGKKDSPMAKKIAAEVPEPKTKADFKKSIGSFVQKHKLNKFFPSSDSPLLETLVSKAVDLQNDDTSVLGQSTNTENLVKFALYQPVIYCDDSGSMQPASNGSEDRWGSQANLARRIASICTQVVPDHLGVHLRFINTHLPHGDDLRMDDIENTVSQLHPGGTTEIGTYLRKRILEPLVYNNPQMTRPLFVSIITDGVPSGPKGSPENRNTLRDEIIRCQTWLEENRLPPRAVVFQISQIGSDPDSKTFLDNLANDSRLTNVYVTSTQLDKQFRELRQNERDLEAWLFQTLLTPILDLRNV